MLLKGAPSLVLAAPRTDSDPAEEVAGKRDEVWSGPGPPA